MEVFMPCDKTEWWDENNEPGSVWCAVRQAARVALGHLEAKYEMSENTRLKMCVNSDINSIPWEPSPARNSYQQVD